MSSNKVVRVTYHIDEDDEDFGEVDIGNEKSDDLFATLLADAGRLPCEFEVSDDEDDADDDDYDESPCPCVDCGKIHPFSECADDDADDLFATLLADCPQK